MWIVYILSHTSGAIYIGVTSDLKRRIKEHNARGVKFTTRTNGTWKFVYAEAYAGKECAFDRERKLKHHGRAKQELLRRIDCCLWPKSGAGRSE